MIDYAFVRNDLPPLPAGVMYQYLVGANGIFIQAKRPGLYALAWVAATPKPLAGLEKVEPRVFVIHRVPAALVMTMLYQSYRARPNEALFYLQAEGLQPWWLVIPDQVASPGSVRPADPFNPDAAKALIEVHSHHTMRPFFSSTDDRDETGFKIYAVIGDIDRRRASIRTRVGIYGHFWEIPSDWIFEMPRGLNDALMEDGDE